MTSTPAQWAQVRGFSRSCALSCGPEAYLQASQSVSAELEQDGERGRNQTFNLLISNQLTTNQWLQRFPKRLRGHT